MGELEQLQEAFDKLKEVEEILDSLIEDKESSLNEYYGYSLKGLSQQINAIADNGVGVITKETNLQEIIESEGELWTEIK
jgi:hypothetical protein